MRILALPKGPDDDCQFYQVAGQRRRLPRHHARPSQPGQPDVQGRDPSAGGDIPSQWPAGRSRCFTIATTMVAPAYGKDSFLIFDPPADGEYQVRVADASGGHGPSHAYRVTVRPPRPDFSISFNPTTPAVWKGGAIPIGVTLARRDGFDGAVRIEARSACRAASMRPRRRLRPGKPRPPSHSTPMPPRAFPRRRR